VGERGEQPEVVIEVHNALHVEGVVHAGAGRVQADEAIQGGQGLGLFIGTVLGVGLFKFGLLRQGRAGSTAFELFEQGDGLVVGA